MGNIIIGICGGTGSGKTTLAKKIYDSLGDGAVLISMDSYYRDNSALTYEERTKINYDHPNSIDTELLLEHLSLLREGKDIDVPCYDFTVHNRVPRTEHKEWRRVVIVEGIMLFTDERIRDMLDIKIFVDTDADVRILRRLRRDVHDRGRSVESVISQYLTTVKPMHDGFIEPTKKYADIIVPEGGKNRIAFNVIVGGVLEMLNDVFM